MAVTYQKVSEILKRGEHARPLAVVLIHVLCCPETRLSPNVLFFQSNQATSNAGNASQNRKWHRTRTWPYLYKNGPETRRLQVGYEGWLGVRRRSFAPDPGEMVRARPAAAVTGK